MTFLTLLPGLILFFISYLRARKLLFPDLFFGSSVLLLFFLLGIVVSSLHLPQHQPNHYLNKISSEEIPLLKLGIKESLKPDLYSNKFIAEVEAVNGKSSFGKLLLLTPKDSLKKPFLEGEKIMLSSPLDPIAAPLNPHQFDYSAFMSRKDIWRQSDSRKGAYIKLSDHNSGISTAAANFRKKITHALEENNFGKDELSLVQALLLGQKQDISAATYNNFAAAGAIHILAVSGLHVGIILLLLHQMFKPLERFKKGKLIKTLIVILCLWGFAILAGLSPSVVRAVTMFSFLAVGMEMNRRTSALNSVFLSLMLLLLIKPQWIFEVGFQLSYLALLSIILFQPLLRHLYSPSNRIGKYFWDLLTVTIAAQVGVLPLSLYYFHQFPGLFFLSNLLILPFLGLILILGVLVIFLALLDILPYYLAETYERIIETLIETVSWIAGHEQFLFKDISFNLPEVLSWYFFFFLLFLLWRSFNYRRIIAVLCSVLVLQAVYITSEFQKSDRLIIFHKNRNSIIGIQENGKLKAYHDLKVPAKDLRLLQNYTVGEDLSGIEEKPLKNIYIQKGHFLIMIDSSGILPQEIPQDTKLLLTGSPRLNFDRVLSNSKPKVIIADGSNYPSLIKKWEETAIKNNIPFYYTGQDGAYIIE
ncbi:ComEC/Rec2 family competence protein [Salinimicrobium sp. TH3]|uniref:ComEC/Rec2 family competence protein n=1 Tax=Salinimicrobium sp. TH3 TaxID=2997342 RepID=UPI0022746664|nr:ComEC/Rec2 family competence protein [Salinimicrobium sp. TH3]MCY2688634.1 ComEC/Rec2 family competence protein [Salinimicrobium sp. TH3]